MSADPTYDEAWRVIRRHQQARLDAVMDVKARIAPLLDELEPNWVRNLAEGILNYGYRRLDGSWRSATEWRRK